VLVRKRDAAVLYGVGVLAYILVGILWIVWRLGSSWFGYRPLTVYQDIHLVAVTSVAFAVLGCLVFACLMLGRHLDQHRRITIGHRVWDLVFVASLAVWIALRMVIFRLEASGLAGGLHNEGFMYEPTAPATIGCVGALVLWFKGTRGVALLMALYVVLFAAWLGDWFSPLLSWFGAR
jgi:hypothetical protein